jgi:HK97 gp10 family phage protein
MADLVDTTAVKGMAEVGEILSKLPLDMKEKVATKATLAAAQVGVAAVQTEVPIRTGNLFRHIRLARRTRDIGRLAVQYVVYIKAGGKRSAKEKQTGEELPFYWYFIEFGTSSESKSHITANPFMLRGFVKSASNAANKARDIAQYWVSKSIGKGKS